MCGCDHDPKFKFLSVNKSSRRGPSVMSLVSLMPPDTWVCGAASTQTLANCWQPRVRKTGGSPAIGPLKSSSTGLEASLQPSAPQSFSGKSRFLSAQFCSSQVHYRNLYSGMLQLLKVTHSEKVWGATHRTLAFCCAVSHCICPGAAGLSSRG